MGSPRARRAENEVVPGKEPWLVLGFQYSVTAFENLPAEVERA